MAKEDTLMCAGNFKYIAGNVSGVYADFIGIAQSSKFSRMFLANKICIKHFVMLSFFPLFFVRLVYFFSLIINELQNKMKIVCTILAQYNYSTYICIIKFNNGFDLNKK